MNKNTLLRCVLYSVYLISSCCISVGLHAQQNTLELESVFKGNQEQPKVLYIVPWQPIQAPPASYQPMQSLINENFQLLDREEFRRDVSYREHRKRLSKNESGQ